MFTNHTATSVYLDAIQIVQSFKLSYQLVWGKYLNIDPEEVD